MSWILRMAWRDTRTSRRRLLLYTASITLGIAALVSIASLGESLRGAIRQQSAGLLGADLVARSNEVFDEEAEKFFAELGGEQAREVSFSSMILHPRTGSSRLVSVRAIDDGFPFYGAFETNPAGAAETFRAERGALVEENIMLQFGAKVGDELKLGTSTFLIAGALQSVPGESPGFNLVAPRVYVPRSAIDETGLIQKGSRVSHRVYFATGDEIDLEALREERKDEWREKGVRLETVGSREANLGNSIGNVERFLSLVGFVALLLGGVGVASGIHVFIRQKLGSIAVLRCVGATTAQTVAIHLVQAAGLGFAGAVFGTLLGVAIQASLPVLLADMLPLEVELEVSWSAVIEGLVAGVGITIALALLPLLGVRRVSPLLALRSTIEPARGSWRDPATLGVVAIGLVAVTLFAVRQSTRWEHGVGVVAGTATVFVALAALGYAMMHIARRVLPARAPYVWRQGLANLFRPNNRTLLVVLALGLGKFLIVSMQLTQRMLLSQLELAEAGNRSNVMLFDIQQDQREAVRDSIEDLGLSVIDEAPIVTMRLASVNGRPVEEIREDPKRTTPRWVLNREYRSTYRGALNDAEEIVNGAFTARHDIDAGPVPVSIEREIADDLGVEVGDSLVFDVQGVPIEAVVGGTRRIDTKRVAPFFFVVFPEGVLEEAPGFAIMTTHVTDSAESGQLQRTLFEQFPNVSVVDLMLILETLNDIFDKVGFVFRFMAAFIVGTGLIVLAGVMASGRFQRLRESVLLRTLGASRRQIARIQLIEYWILGTLASLAGVILAWAAAWILGRWMFELRTIPDVGPMVVAWVVVSALTIITGTLSGRRMLNHPPLEVLREEV